MITITNLFDAFPVLLNDNETFEQLKKDFPEILADLITFKNNPNCSCRGKVFKFFTDQLEKEPTILNKYIKDQALLRAKLQDAAQKRMENNYTGRFFTVDKSEEAWKNFAASLQGKMFRNFSVVEKEDKIVVYFL